METPKPVLSMKIEIGFANLLPDDMLANFDLAVASARASLVGGTELLRALYDRGYAVVNPGASIIDAIDAEIIETLNARAEEQAGAIFRAAAPTPEQAAQAAEARADLAAAFGHECVCCPDCCEECLED